MSYVPDLLPGTLELLILEILTGGGGNWEGAGVTPDVKVPAADALQTAHDRLLRTLGR